MADPKFANLPGIAYDQPDIYETGDVSEPETSDFYEEENECIERLHISTKDSYNKFKGKYLTGTVDFSDRIGRKIRTGYDARSGEWELAGEGEKESPLQRCRRLQCEMDELMQEIATIQMDTKISKDEKESYETVSSVVNNAKKILDSLKLEQILGKETVANSNVDSDVKELIAKVEEYKKSGIGQIKFVPITNNNNNNSAGGELVRTTRIATLEHRLHELERAVGMKPEKLSRLTASLGTINLLDTAQQLSKRAALLQPSQLDLIEARLNNLGTKLDTLAEKSTTAAATTTTTTGDGSGGGTAVAVDSAARDQKTLELYEIAKRTEPITQILPDILNRMQALESLHSYASNFSKIISEQELVQQNLNINLTNNKQLLQGVQEAIAVNLENVNKEVVKLEDRITKISTIFQSK